MTKEYIIVGDNNYWYATLNSTEKIARAEMKRIKKDIKNNVYDDLADELYLFEAKEISSLKI